MPRACPVEAHVFFACGTHKSLESTVVRLLRNVKQLAERNTHSLRSRRLCVLCVFLGPIEHTQFSDLLSVPHQSNEKAEDAETPRTQRLDLHFASFISLSACRQISRACSTAQGRGSIGFVHR